MKFTRSQINGKTKNLIIQSLDAPIADIMERRGKFDTGAYCALNDASTSFLIDAPKDLVSMGLDPRFNFGAHYFFQYNGYLYVLKYNSASYEMEIRNRALGDCNISEFLSDLLDALRAFHVNNEFKIKNIIENKGL